LTGKRKDVETLWVGGEGGMEADLVSRAGISYRSIPAAGVHGVGVRALPGNLARLGRGVLASRSILKGFRPEVMFFTGGYVAAPVAIAGYRVPLVLYVPDIEPGLALKFLARFADRITLTAQASKKYFARPGRLVVTGYPLRPDLTAWPREKAIRHFGLSPDLPVVLITGGSKGARSINMAVLNHLKGLVEAAQVVHISGSLDWPVVEKAARELPDSLKSRYHVMPYSHDMGVVFSAADLVVSRAGASTLGEYPFFGLPAVLVPYPYAWHYQKVNADHLADQNAAVILHDELLERKLAVVVKDLLGNKTKLAAMQAAMKSLYQPGAAEAIAGQLEVLAGEQPI
jgi:UDP-N-acetylglucosamine--N-acetylmuramyl-(pentapeptide) pyrophosphoryl-undecaprenol N-acetylglucosamine transferase